MNGTQLELSNEARLLGVTLDSKLTWKPHITRITRKATTALMQCRQIVGKTWGNNTIYDEMDIHSCDTPTMSNACVLGWRSQQKVSSEETHKGAETCLPDDFVSFSWHLYWCSRNFAQHNSHLEEFLLAEAVRGSYRITVSELWHVNPIGSFGKTKSHVDVCNEARKFLPLLQMPADRIKKTKLFERNFECQNMDKNMLSDLKAF